MLLYGSTLEFRNHAIFGILSSLYPYGERGLNNERMVSLVNFGQAFCCVCSLLELLLLCRDEALLKHDVVRKNSTGHTFKSIHGSGPVQSGS